MNCAEQLKIFLRKRLTMAVQLKPNQTLNLKIKRLGINGEGIA